MIVYRDLECLVDGQALLSRLSATLQEQLRSPRPSHATAVQLLIEFGQLEAAWCDALMPEADADLPAGRLLRRVALGLGHRLRSAWLDVAPPAHVTDAGAMIAALQHIRPAPSRLRIKVPEGFAFYGLYPETYMQAAADFARTHPPAKAICIGLRSIGTALSAIAGAQLESCGWDVISYTLRPRGEPFARRPVLAPSLAMLLQQHSAHYALVIDEGPGISGSSLTGTAAMLHDLGYSDDRIILFPSWKPDASRLHSSEAQARWPRHTVHVGSFEETWIDSGRLSNAPLRPIDQGRWRGLFFRENDYPAVQPQHERRKFITIERTPMLLKFVGLGSFGNAAHDRALKLSQAGYIPPVLELRHGFLASPYVTGKPLEIRDCTMGLLDTAARYFAFIQRNFPAERPTSGNELRAMVVANTRELLGRDGEGISDLLRGHEFDPAQAVALDARTQPWEWIVTAHGYLKTDALDHHADHFFPGCTDIAWDIAGFSIEFDLDVHGTELLTRLFARYGGDARVGARVALFRLAYAAFRGGYTALAEFTTAGTPEAERFSVLTERYRTQLQRALFEYRRENGRP